MKDPDNYDEQDSPFYVPPVPRDYYTNNRPNWAPNDSTLYSRNTKKPAPKNTSSEKPQSDFACFIGMLLSIGSKKR